MSEKVATDLKPVAGDSDQQQVSEVYTATSDNAAEIIKSKHDGKWYASLFEAGSATQIVIAAILAIALGLGITAAVDEVPVSVVKILGIPGQLWLRCLKAVGMLISEENLPVGHADRI